MIASGLGLRWPPRSPDRGTSSNQHDMVVGSLRGVNGGGVLQADPRVMWQAEALSTGFSVGVHLEKLPAVPYSLGGVDDLRAGVDLAE